MNVGVRVTNLRPLPHSGCRDPHTTPHPNDFLDDDELTTTEPWVCIDCCGLCRPDVNRRRRRRRYRRALALAQCRQYATPPPPSVLPPAPVAPQVPVPISPVPSIAPMYPQIQQPVEQQSVITRLKDAVCGRPSTSMIAPIQQYPSYPYLQSPYVQHQPSVIPQPSMIPYERCLQECCRREREKLDQQYSRGFLSSCCTPSSVAPQTSGKEPEIPATPDRADMYDQAMSANICCKDYFAREVQQKRPNVEKQSTNGNNWLESYPKLNDPSIPVYQRQPEKLKHSLSDWPQRSCDPSFGLGRDAEHKVSSGKTASEVLEAEVREQCRALCEEIRNIYTSQSRKPLDCSSSRSCPMPSSQNCQLLCNKHGDVCQFNLSKSVEDGTRQKPVEKVSQERKTKTLSNIGEKSNEGISSERVMFELKLPKHERAGKSDQLFEFKTKKRRTFSDISTLLPPPEVLQTRRLCAQRGSLDVSQYGRRRGGADVCRTRSKSREALKSHARILVENVMSRIRGVSRNRLENQCSSEKPRESSEVSRTVRCV